MWCISYKGACPNKDVCIKLYILYNIYIYIKEILY